MTDTSVVRVGAATFGSDGLTLIADLGMAGTPEPAVAAARRRLGPHRPGRGRADGGGRRSRPAGHRVRAGSARGGSRRRVGRHPADRGVRPPAPGQGRPVLLERGPHATVEDWLPAAERLAAAGAPGIVLCERRGAARTGPDVGMVPFVRRRSALPVVVDPGSDLVLPLSLAAIGAGADGLIVAAMALQSTARDRAIRERAPPASAPRRPTPDVPGSSTQVTSPRSPSRHCRGRRR
jgi:hypothetical protein